MIDVRNKKTFRDNKGIVESIRPTRDSALERMTTSTRNKYNTSSVLDRIPQNERNPYNTHKTQGDIAFEKLNKNKSSTNNQSIRDKMNNVQNAHDRQSTDSRVRSMGRQNRTKMNIGTETKR